MAAEHNIDVIDIVRKQETADLLISNGAKNVLVETDENFNAKLEKLVSQLNPRRTIGQYIQCVAW